MTIPSLFELTHVSRSVMSDSLRPHELCPARLHRPWNFPGKDAGVGCHSLLQGILLIQGSNPGLLHHRPRLSHQESYENGAKW